MKRTQDTADFIAQETICDDIRDGVLSASSTDINSFTSYALPSKGHHIVNVLLWEVVPEREIVNRYQGKVVSSGEFTKKYIRLDLRDADNGSVYEAKLYPAMVPFFMNNMVNQTEGAVLGMTLEQILKYFTTHDMDIWVRWSSQYGVQIDYYEKRELK